MQKLFSYLFILALSSYLVFGLDENLVKEKECIPAPGENVGIDLKWLESVERFFLPVWSKLYAYRVASEFFEKNVEEISEQDVSQATCLVFKKNNVVKAYNRELTYNITGDGTSLTFRAPWEGAKSGKFDFHLTDNKSFILGITCWEDNQSSWAVLTTVPFITYELKAKVLNCVSSLGFRLDLAVQELSDTCPASDFSNGATVGQLPIEHNYVLVYPNGLHSYYPLPLGFYR